MKRLRRKHIIRLNRKARKQETPIFERLEPRLLLNADVTGLSGTQNIAPLSTDQPDNTVDVSLDTQSNSLTADAQLVLVHHRRYPTHRISRRESLTHPRAGNITRTARAKYRLLGESFSWMTMASIMFIP